MINLPEILKIPYHIPEYPPLVILIEILIVITIGLFIRRINNTWIIERWSRKTNKTPQTVPIIIGEYNDAVTVLFDHAAECALIVCNRDPETEGSSIVWAYTKVLDVVANYDKNHLFFINMANEDFYVRYLNNAYLKLDEKQSKILKGYPTNCDEIMNALFLINYNGISAGFEGSFLCKSE